MASVSQFAKSTAEPDQLDCEKHPSGPRPDRDRNHRPDAHSL